MLIQLNLSEDEIRELNYKRFRESQPLLQKRLHALYLKSTMQISNEYIANILDSHRNSVDSWVHSYMEGGLEGLIALHYKPRESELAEYREQIKEELSNDYIQTTVEFSHRIFLTLTLLFY